MDYNIGLSKELIEKIKDITKKFENYKFYVFGSRAKGTYKNNSDIDIAIYEEVSEDDKYKIMNEFDLLDTIYKIDLVFINKTTNKQLLKSINENKIIL